MRKEFEEQQKKSVVGNVAGGGNPLQSLDLAGWMAGQTSGKSGEAQDTVTSGREREADSGKGVGSGRGGGGGQGKKRRG